jgi:hypothetical protein
MSTILNLVSRYRLLRHAAMAALVLPAALLTACAQEPPPPAPAPVQAAPPAPAPAPVVVPRARG